MPFNSTRINLGAPEQTATSGSGRDPWQEALARYLTVPAARVSEAAEVIRGFAGSWAASYMFDPGSRTNLKAQEPRIPSPQQVKVSRLGQPGSPEINFVPYAYRTNRFGPKGGALLGHPISFAVVGPTAKRGSLQFQWAVTDNSSTPAVGDVLTLNAAGADTIQTLYGFSSLTDFQNNLYLVISLTGGAGTLIDAGGNLHVGGAGDGCLVATTPEVPLRPKDLTSKYEIFRVASIGATFLTLTLDPVKHLATYFTFPGGQDTPCVRAITLLTPKASRLLAIPGSGTRGQEQAFVVVPPDRALNDDMQYLYKEWTDAVFREEIWGQATNGTTWGSTYTAQPLLPIPRPKWELSLRVTGENVAQVIEPPIDSGPGNATFIATGPSPLPESPLGKILHIHGIRVRGTGQLFIAPDGTQVPLSALLGWFEVVEYAVQSDRVTVRRVDEIDPLVGRAYWGNGNNIVLDSLGGTLVEGDGIDLQATVHDPIETLWTQSYFDADQIQSARLTNLINPDWVERSAKQPSLLPGLSPARADKAVFDTASTNGGASGTCANPGSLMDLGFRAVLYPATAYSDQAGWHIIPDWDRPCTSNEVLLDPTVPGEKQYVEIDYSNGLVRLSHPVKDGSPLYPASAHVFDAVDNPRGELVLFACCVPYSQEEGQLGSGVRVTGGNAPDPTTYCAADGSVPDLAASPDVYGTRTAYPLITQTVASGSAPGFNIVLSGHVANQIPSTGFVEVLLGTTVDGEPAFADGYAYRGSVFGYQSVTEVGGPDRTILHDIFGGGESLATVNVTAGDPAVAVVRRDVALPNTTDGRVGTDYQHDVTFGAGKRSTSLRFADAELFHNVDGTVTVRPRETLAQSSRALFEDLFSSWILDGGRLTSTVPPTVGAGNTYLLDYESMTILMKGSRKVLPAGVVAVPDNGTCYVYVDSTIPAAGSCYPVTYALSLPLPNPDDILLYRVITTPNPGGTVELLDLRNPQRDVDRRADIYVGQIGQPGWSGFEPHFDNLADAVAYANELMTPSVGDKGRALRIRVVGRTDEDVSKLPIVLKTNGLIIEGSPWTHTSAQTYISEVTWDSDVHLIDFNGHSHLIFRDLAFRHWGVGNPLNPSVRNVFTNTAAQTDFSDIQISNCRVAGLVQGFVYINVGGTISRLTIRDNVAEKPLDSGIFLGGNFTGVADLVITGNHFVQNTAAGSFSADGIYCGEQATGGTRVTIRDNYLEGFLRGIVTNTTHFTIENNYIARTANRGISASSTGTVGLVRNNRLVGVHTDAGAPKIGILAGTEMTIEGNTVTLDTPTVDVDVGIQVLGDNSHVVRNQAYSMDAQGDLVDLSENFVDTFIWLRGAANTLRGNRCQTLSAGFSYWSNPQAFIVDSIGHQLIGNIVSYHGYLAEGCRAVGNIFLDQARIVDLFVYKSCQLEGNEIGWLKDYTDVPTLVGEDDSNNVSLVNNRITQVGEDNGNPQIMDGIFQGSDLRVAGNEFSNIVLFTTASNSVIEGNQFVTIASLTVGTVAGTPVNAAIIASNKLADASGGTLTLYCHASTITGNSTWNDSANPGTLLVQGMYNTITGNESGATSINGVRSTIQGNRFWGHLTLGSINQTGGEFQVTGNILAPATGSPLDSDLIVGILTPNCTLVGNRCRDLIVYHDLVGTVLVGNWVLRDIKTENGGVLPGYIAVGNRADNVFGFAKGNASIDEHNAEV